MRKARGFTQTELGSLICLSQSMMTYYGGRTIWPSAHLMPRLAETVGVSMDELTGVQPVADAPPRRHSRLWRKLRKIEDQQALLTIDAFLRKAT